jgi:hypothetical protein
MLGADEENEYKLKRKRNNESVKQCRERDKLKIEKAREDVEKYKSENLTLKEKYEELQKELNVLKSLFNQNSSRTNEATSDVSTLSIQNALPGPASTQALTDKTSKRLILRCWYQ